MVTTGTVTHKTITSVIELSRILGEYGAVKRVTLLPNGEFESDSHHSLVVALTAYQLGQEFAPELEAEKLLLYGLVHDLPELVTGDVPTLLATEEELADKNRQDALALEQACVLFAEYPAIVRALRAYEKGEDDEALFVYWIDKMITIPTHFPDKGANLRSMGVKNRQDIAAWYAKAQAKLSKRPGTPHPAAVRIMEMAYERMRDELLG